MTVTTEAVPDEQPDDQPAGEPGRLEILLLNPATRITLRWLLILILTLIAFWPSLASLKDTTEGGGLNGYVWMVPIAGILAAIGVARRPRTDLPIHDRQTDVIVGVMGLVFAVLLCGVLMRRYGLYFHLLRFDLLGMWVFVISAAILLFGLRPIGRFLAVWILMLMIFTLPYHIMVILLGGNRIAAGAGTLVIAGAATSIAVGRTVRRGWIGALAAWAVGLTVLLVMAVVTPYAPVIVYQTVPALIAIVLVGLSMFVMARRGAPKRALDRSIHPVASKQVLSVVPLLVVVTILLTFVKLPSPGNPPMTRFDGLSITGPLVVPDGWRMTAEEDYPWVERLHGRISHLTRQRMVADVGNPEWDKLSRPRTVVVDNVITDRPFSFNVYPAKVLYDVSATRLSQVRRVELGFGVTGELISGVDDHLLVTWNMLQWTWRNENRAQRVLIFTVDNHDDDAPFPEPSGALLPTLNALLTVLFRGNSAVDDTRPEFKDADLLTVFGRGLVSAQLAPMGLTP